MTENTNKHNFLTVNELGDFNAKVKTIIFDKPSKKVEEPAPKEETELIEETTAFEGVTVNPKELDTDLLYQLADIIDKKSHYNLNDTESSKDAAGPSTSDNIYNALTVSYVLEEGLPVAVSILHDPTVVNYKNLIPGDYYELKTGKSLENRLQQEYFSFKPDKYNKSLAQELIKQITSTAAKVFIVNSTTDTETRDYLLENGYKLIAIFKTDWENESVELWIN